MDLCVACRQLGHLFHSLFVCLDSHYCILILLLLFFDPLPASVDARKGVSLDAARRVTDENLASRSYMNTVSKPYAHMMLELLTPEDAGEYACRVDFRKERTRNSVIFLKIISKYAARSGVGG